MSIRFKVIASFIAILLLFGAVSFYNYVRFSESNKQLALVDKVFMPMSRLIAELQGRIYTLAEDLKRFHFHPSAGLQSPEKSTISRVARDLYPYMIRRKFDQMERLLSIPVTADVQPMMRELKASVVKTREKFRQFLTIENEKKFNTRYISLRNQMGLLSVRLDNEAQKMTKGIQVERRDSLIASLSLSVLVAVFGVFTVLFSYKALRPLPLLIDRLKKIADGDFLQSLKVETKKDEISLLAREYNRMLDALCKRDKKIQLQQKELLQSERLAAVGQLSAEVVHEIRNPLNSISLNIDWLRSELGSKDDEIEKTLKSISRETERLNQITESYLVRARVDSQHEEKAEVHEVLQELIDFSREEHKAKKIEIEKKFFSQPIYVRTTKARLKQVFLNVLRNANDAMPSGGTITIRSCLERNTSKVQFSDTGCGMNEATQHKTFSPFFTTKRSGTGLGLALTKSIVEEAQGTIFCESKMGKGTTFTLQFPV